MIIVTRGQAIAQSKVRYFTGVPCKNGHVTERYVKHYRCVACRMVTVKSWATRNPEKRLASSRKQDRKGFPEPTRPMPDRCECRGCPPGKKGLHLDHDHVTGEFRGWICVNCNTGLGKLGDNRAGLEIALAYLDRAKS